MIRLADRAALLSLLLAGCTTTPHLAPAPATLSVAYRAAQPGGVGEFWSSLDDPLLMRYLQIANSQNLDLAAALARLGQARAIAQGARAALAPELRATLSAARQQNSIASGIPLQPRDTNTFDATFDAAWELDIFGRLRAEARAARGDVAAAALDLQALRITTRAETARLYYAARATQLRIEVLDHAADAQSDLAQLAASRARAGLVPETDALRARGLAASSRAAAAALRADLADTIAALALILGRTAASVGPELDTRLDLPRARSPLLGAPADLLTRRPDVRRDLARLEAADARAAARARDRLPRLTLSATGGYSAAATATLFTPGAQVLGIGAALAGPVVDFGRRKAVARQAEAIADERAANLRATVLTAVREVERDAAALSSTNLQLEARAEEIADNRAVAASLRRRYLAGLDDFTAALDAERVALASADAEILARRAQIDAALSLWKSVGGPLDQSPP